MLNVGEQMGDTICRVYGNLIIAGDNHHDPSNVSGALYRSAYTGSCRWHSCTVKYLFELYSDFTDKTVSQVSLTKKMMQTIKLGVNSGMVFEKGIFAIIRSLMYLDGMVLRCNPDAVSMKDMRRFVKEFKSLI